MQLCKTDQTSFKHGIPQGSILGPQRFFLHDTTLRLTKLSVFVSSKLANMCTDEWLLPNNQSYIYIRKLIQKLNLIGESVVTKLVHKTLEFGIINY